MKIRISNPCSLLLLLVALLFSPLSSNVRAEALLQIFNVSYVELIQKIPELAEAGYGSIWFPPPTKGSGGLSVGYDMYDPFDFGQKDQRDTVRTRYGTEAELIQMMKVAHRFGLRVYFDDIMNHRSFDIPGENETTPTGGEGQTETYPGMVPEDFHLQKTEDGFYRKWNNTRDWNSAWQVQNLGLADLIDIAQESGNNLNFGTSEGSTHPKYGFVRDLNRPEQYDKDKDGNTVYFGWLIDRAKVALGANAKTEDLRDHAKAYILENRPAYVEYVEKYLERAVRWKIDRLKADGLRLDAVKHVSDYFFGKQSGADKDSSTDGYLGQVQWQFDRTRGFGADNSLLSGYNSDVNKRDSVFDEKRPRNDAMVFGEHLGLPPSYNGYWDAGMRLVDNDLRSKLNGVLGSLSTGLQGLDSPGAGGFSPSLGVTHANSHDSDYAAQKEWQHAFYMTREGMGLIYSDGYNQAETLGESGGAFPRHANTKYLGQFSDPRIPNILKIHNDFARGLQQGLWAGSDLLVFERRDNRNPDGSTRSGSAADEITMVMMMNDNTAYGVRDDQRRWNSSFPSNAYLYQYARGPNMSGFYKYANELNNELVPAGGYYVFSYRTPEPSTLWPNAAITLYQTNPSGGQLEEVPRITVTRKDGRDGDASFNPEGLTNRGYPDGTTPVPYTYQTSVPVVKAGQPFTIIARADGSAENILVKLDGGVDLNGTGLGDDPAKRDNPPGLRTDTYLGYEQPTFVDRERQHPEKFAAIDITRCQIGSVGAETYAKTIGGSATANNGPNAANDSGTENGNQPSWLYHNPNASVGGTAGTMGVGGSQFVEEASDVIIWVKSNSVGDGYRFFVYYTTDETYPEGAGGIGRGTTKAAELFWRHNQGSDDWWSSASIPKPAGGTKFTYKIGAYKNEGSRAPSWFPNDPISVAYKKKMLTTFKVADFDPAAVVHFPHNDYARTPTLGQLYENWPYATQTGLSEGFHVLRARAFLKRDGQAPLYNTFTQTFYYDAETPQGDLAFPTNNGDTVGGSSYEMVVRTDTTVQEVWYSISDSDTTNDDTTTKQQNGNGAGFEPYVNANDDKVWNTGETFTDLNGNGMYDTTLNPTWAKATEVTPSPSVTSSQPREWRFTYNNIPLTGAGTIKIRLLEASSSRNFTLDPTVSHVREITRVVETRGKAQRLIIAFPTNDGDSVDDNYTMHIYFPKSLSDVSISESQMIARFTFLAQGNAQLRTGWSINYGNFGPGDAFHQLSIPLANLYNSSVNLQEFRVIYKDPADLKTPENWLTSSRFVNVRPSNQPFIRITRPTEVDSDGKPTEIILPDGPGADTLTYVVQVETSTGVTSAPTLTGITTSNPTSVVNGNIKTWSYPWSITAPGNYTLEAESLLSGTTPTKTSGTARVILRQIVDPSGQNDQDDDHDGLVNIDETNQKALPTTGSEKWSNDEIHIHYATGRSLPTSPDSDGDGLPDALEVGWQKAVAPTDTTVDTNGDGIPNFLGDLDPPLYNAIKNYPAVPGSTAAGIGTRNDKIAGSVTDPTNPDTDADGLPDGVEDADFNGWTDGDGKSLPLTASIDQYATARPTIEEWPNNTVESWEIWQETSPTKADSDDDGLTDGYGEDNNLNGKTDLELLYADGTTKLLLLELETNLLDSETGETLAIAGSDYRLGDATTRSINYASLLGVKSTNQPNVIVGGAYRIDGEGTRQTDGWPKIVITETDPLNSDTDGDGLPDGWEFNNGLDPLDNGTYKFLTGGLGDPKNGAAGDPDNDTKTNQEEYLAGSDPQKDDRVAPVTGQGTIRIGTFLDWKPDDLLALDEYDNGGNVSDIYRTYDSYDTSRDLVAFSFRDGGDTAASGDGKLYFRADFLDLQANAWQGYVDLYVVINIGNTGAGEKALPEQVDLTTTMGWQATIAVYGQNSGTLYVDTDPANNTGNVYQDPSVSGFGVISRGIGSTGLVAAQWSSTQDACEFSINRQTLKDLGWNGDPSTLHFQVFTTKDGTSNSPAGAGDLSGRNDLRDTIGDDWICSDYWKDSSNISLNAKLSSWFGRGDPWNDRGKAAKVLLLAHANQALQPASFIHGLIKSTAINGPGYSRWLKVHEDNSAPVSLHFTATLASALQWATSTDPTKDGPTLNARIKAGVAQGWLDVLGSTFADHVLKYFPLEMNRQNVMAARDILDGIYGSESAQSSRSVFWPCERVLDNASLEQIRQIGFPYTFADQGRHLVKWFGRTSALGDSGYRINEVNGIKIIPIHDSASDYLSQTSDSGTAIAIRQLLSRRARSGVEDQVVTLWRDLGDMGNDTILTSYETNVRWLVNRPWVKLVTATDIAAGRVPYKGTDGQSYTTWGPVDQGTNKLLTTTAKDWVDHASQENYDNWYNGSSFESGLKNKTFAIRGTTPVPQSFGQPGTANTISDRVCSALSAIGDSQPLAPLSRATLGASLFQTAFHTTSNNDLSKFSTGDYMNPDTGTGQTLADFAKFSQAQTRQAGLYARVQLWDTTANSTTLVSATEDVDLDGENEYLLYNSRLFAVFEKSGGRMTAAWMRDPNTSTSQVWQVVGNLAAYSNTETEDEGASNFVGTTTILSAYRTSGFKDWWVVSSGGSGNNNRVNSLYTVTQATDGTGWVLDSQDGSQNGVTKTIRLANASSDRLTATYTFSGQTSAFIRFGLSPNLQDLMVSGQSGLAVTTTNNRINVANVSNSGTVRASVQVSSDASNPGNSSSINTTATDTGGLSSFSTINMRNQAQTQQVEVALMGEGPHTVTLAFDQGIDNPDTDSDGLPDDWESTNFGNLGQLANGDPDNDRLTNLQEYAVGSNPNSASSGMPTVEVSGTTASGFTITFPTVAGRTYQVLGAESLTSSSWPNIGSSIQGDDATHTVHDSSSINSSSKFYKVKITAP